MNISLCCVRRCTKMIEVLAHFAPHFTAGEIEDIARRMDIWRQPLADLESPYILRFKYNSKLTWRTWPKSSPLDRFEQVSFAVLHSRSKIKRNGEWFTGD